MEKINFKSLPDTSTPVTATNLNQLQTNVENAINGVVESGSNSNGSWIKYDDGVMICHGKITINGKIETAWGSLYYLEDNVARYFSQSFISPPEIQTSIDYTTDSGFIIGMIGNDREVTNNYFKGVTLIRPTARANDEYKVNYMAIGRWK